MPVLRRPDGAEIHWEERGGGPLVLLAPHSVAFPAIYADLIDQLARDHRVLTYDPRGAGESTRVVPSSEQEDIEDLEALLEAASGGAVGVGMGDGGARTAAVANRRPDLVGAVVVAGASSVPPGTLKGAQGPVSSPSVVESMIELADRNPRAGMRALLELTNPGMTPEQVRARLDATLAYSSAEAILARHRWFYAGAALEDLRALGDRLWIARWESAWSPHEVTEELRKLLPKARIENLTEGAIARPDLTADLVRKAVACVSEAQI